MSEIEHKDINMSMQLPDPEVAYDTLLRRVRANVLFNKLAAHGIRPANEEEALQLLGTAARLRLLSEQPEAKAASAGLFSRVNQQLDSRLKQLAPQFAASNEDNAIKEAAAQFAADPDIYGSMLSLMQAEAELAAQG